MLDRPSLRILLLAGAFGIAGPAPPLVCPFRAATQVTGSAAGQHATVGVSVFDPRGQPIADLRPGDFSVTVDGQRRNVVRACYVFRGPGAGAAAAQAKPPARSEVRRRFLVVIDLGSLLSVDERAVRTLVSGLIDRLGPADDLAVVMLPSPDARVEFASDREGALETLRKVSGRAVPASAAAAPGPLPTTPPADTSAAGEQDPDRANRLARQTTDLRALSDAAFEVIGNARPAGGADPLGMLGAVLDSLKTAPEPTTVVFISAGLPDPPRSPALERIGSAAATARAAIHVLCRRVTGWQRSSGASDHGLDAAGTPAPGPDSGRRVAEQDTGLVALAAMTGGSFIEVGRNINQAIERLLGGLGGDYAVTIETPESDWDGKAHELRVAVLAVKGGAVRYRTRWLPVRDPVPETVEMAQPAVSQTPVPSVTLGPSPVRAPSTTPPSPRLDPELEVVLASVDEYLAAYERELSGIVAEERYFQIARYRMSASSNERQSTVELRSDFLLVKPAGGGMWLPFRDVFEVDGSPVRDHDERLKKLFLEKSSEAVSEAQRITDESARYNVGSVERNVNVPTFPLGFLKASNRDRFDLTRHGEELVDGLRVWRIDYLEWASPTFVQTAIGGEDVPVRGSIWVDPANGRIVKTVLRNVKGPVRMDVTVTYRPNATLGLWVPSDMRERYAAGDVTIDGSATYTNFRRFRVLTEEQIRIPK